MNRFRRLTGPNSYQSETGLDLAKLLPANGRWLDVGCGTGIAVRELAEDRPDVSIVALDREGGFDDGRPWPTNVRFLRASVEEFNSDERFDCITLVHVLHFVDDKQACLDRLKGALLSEGLLRANLDEGDVYLGADWASAKPLGNREVVLTEGFEGWGRFVGSRDQETNRQGVRSRSSLYL